MPKDAFFEMVCETYFQIPPLRGDEKKFIEHLKNHGAHMVFPRAEIWRPECRELLANLLAMYWRGSLVHLSITLHA